MSLETFVDGELITDNFSNREGVIRQQGKAKDLEKQANV